MDFRRLSDIFPIRRLSDSSIYRRLNINRRLSDGGEFFFFKTTLTGRRFTKENRRLTKENRHLTVA